jgi:hypothetical protein
VTFDEDEALKKSRESHMDEDREEKEDPSDAIMVVSTPEGPIPKDQNETVDPKRPVDPPK